MNRTHNQNEVSCYFYHNVDLGEAHAQTCDYYQRLGYCPCVGCEKYIPKKQARDIIKAHVDSRIEKEENDQNGTN